VPQGLAGLRARVLAVFDYQDAVHEHMRNARGIMVRVFVSGVVLNLVGVEYHEQAIMVFGWRMKVFRSSSWVRLTSW